MFQLLGKICAGISELFGAKFDKDVAVRLPANSHQKVYKDPGNPVRVKRNLYCCICDATTEHDVIRSFDHTTYACGLSCQQVAAYDDGVIYEFYGAEDDRYRFKYMMICYPEGAGSHMAAVMGGPERYGMAILKDGEDCNYQIVKRFAGSTECRDTILRVLKHPGLLAFL